ncbi:MAG TPA: patatin-like phospholipase family protein [Solirubrobacteraceae bacterium]|nr:patatin-like phospholipase family protein [Solirubrobacteraceae bacterium]
MGEVVKLKAPKRGSSSSATRAKRKRSAPAKTSSRRKRGRDRTALVLGGGGFTGGVYEIGALRALDLLAANRTVNQFDVYVGTSAGAFVASLCANGVTPEQMMRVVTRQGPQTFRDIDLGDVLQLNLPGFARSGVQLPLRVAGLARRLVPQLGQVSLIDFLLGLAEALPTGAYTGAGIERYLHKVLAQDGRSDDFRDLASELYLVATDLDTCERIVFGADGYDDVPISRAVRASGALPMVYAPVKIGERELIDGGIVSTTNLDIAVEAGAQLVIVINPVVPYVQEPELDSNGVAAPLPRRISDRGFSKIGYQAFKLLAHRRLHELAHMWEERYPGVDIVLIEPEPTDELMFETSIMNFASRIDIARHGFQSVTYHLAEEFERYSEIWARHGIEISERRVRRVVHHFEAEEEERGAWRKILEGTTSALLRQSGSN